MTRFREITKSKIPMPIFNKSSARAIIMAASISFQVTAVGAPREASVPETPPTRIYQVPLTHQANLAESIATPYTAACARSEDTGEAVPVTREVTSGFYFFVLNPKSDASGISFTIHAALTQLKSLKRNPLSPDCDIEVPETEGWQVEKFVQLQHNDPPVSLQLIDDSQLKLTTVRRFGDKADLYLKVERERAANDFDVRQRLSSDTLAVPEFSPSAQKLVTSESNAPTAAVRPHSLLLQVVHRLDDPSGQETYALAWLEPIGKEAPLRYAQHGTVFSASVEPISSSLFNISFEFSSDRVRGRSRIQYVGAVGEIVPLPQLDGSQVYLKLVDSAE
ncbi:hypothetical protein [Achromobacter xylosoxidans]|uniref:hypothetical protein n=1 Tax=Alcaligenes xylosoxydans xylosoxydans TaxID=85698 RepID=UPI0013AFB6A7|nr:hypothetical protein [Achromobacter xylosoxidans]